MLIIKKEDRIHSRIFNSEKPFQIQFTNVYYSSLACGNFCLGHYTKKGIKMKNRSTEEQIQRIRRNMFLLTAAFLITSIWTVRSAITFCILFPNANIIATLKSSVVARNT